MSRSPRWIAVAVGLVAAATLVGAEPIRITEEEMHRSPGGVPRGWKFSVPAGDPAKGRKVFADLECYTCHEVAGQGFPPRAGGAAGPPLAGMGEGHPAEYFAESILNPNAVIIEHPDYVGPDRLSRMPSFNDSLTLQQWIDLVAFLKSLSDTHGGHQTVAVEREKVAGEYRVRLDYVEPAQQRRPGYLRVYVSDAASGQPVPYLPITVRIGAGKATRVVTLSPRIDATGFHYGAGALIPDQTETVTVVVGPAAMPVAGAAGKYRTARRVQFEW